MNIILGDGNYYTFGKAVWTSYFLKDEKIHAPIFCNTLGVQLYQGRYFIFSSYKELLDPLHCFLSKDACFDDCNKING